MSKIKSKKSLSFSESDRLKPPAWLSTVMLKSTPTIFNLKLSVMNLSKVFAIVICVSLVSIFMSCNKEKPLTPECKDCQLCPENPLCPKDENVGTSVIDCNYPNDEQCIDESTIINEGFKNFQIFKQAPVINPPVLIQTTLEEEPNLSCNVKTYKWGLDVEAPFLFDPTSDVIFPGNIIEGESIATGAYRPVLNANRKPLRVSLSSEAFNTQNETIDEPTLSGYRTAWKNMIDSGVDGTVPAKISYSFEKIHSTNQLKVALESNLKVPFASISAKFKFDDSLVKTRLLVKYTQEYYSADIDLHNQPSDLFKVLPDNLTSLSYDPVIVSSVKYGRTLIAMITSTESADTVEAALKAKINFLISGGVDATLKQTQTLNSSNMNVLIMGGTPTAINGAEGSATYVREGLAFSKGSPGIPMAYTLRYVNDRSIAKIVLSSEYNVRDCTEIIEIASITTDKFWPDHIAGDKEFGTIGPNIKISAKIKILKQNEIWATIIFDLKESTEGRGDSKAYLKSDFRLYKASSFEKIIEIKSDTDTEKYYEDRDFDIDILTFEPNELIDQFIVHGHTRNNDIGDGKNDDDSNLIVKFNPIIIEVQ